MWTSRPIQKRSLENLTHLLVCTVRSYNFVNPIVMNEIDAKRKTDVESALGQLADELKQLKYLRGF